jgi:prevent-host-death family protein
MEKVQLHDAKARLSELVDRAQSGEEVVISRHGKAVAKLVGYAPKRAKRRLGILRGKIKFHKGWDDPLPEKILAYFEGRGRD